LLKHPETHGVDPGGEVRARMEEGLLPMQWNSRRKRSSLAVRLAAHHDVRKEPVLQSQNHGFRPRCAPARASSAQQDVTVLPIRTALLCHAPGNSKAMKKYPCMIPSFIHAACGHSHVNRRRVSNDRAEPLCCRRHRGVKGADAQRPSKTLATSDSLASIRGM
jgi:hypothetical protein